MITGAIKNKVDKIWTDIWAGGIANPLTVIEQLTYLMFIRSLDTVNKVSRGNRCNTYGLVALGYAVFKNFKLTLGIILGLRGENINGYAEFFSFLLYSGFHICPEIVRKRFKNNCVFCGSGRRARTVGRFLVVGLTSAACENNADNYRQCHNDT